MAQILTLISTITQRYSFSLVPIHAGAQLQGDSLVCVEQGCRIGVETGVGVGRSRWLRLESASELESVEFCRLRVRPGVAGCHPSTDDHFG